MSKFTKSKYIIIITSLIIISALSGVFAVTFSSPDLYIRIATIDWPPTVDAQTKTYAAYYSYLTCEIWNPHRYNLSIETPNTNLLDSKMSFNLEDDYEIDSGNVAFPIITNHTIRPGVAISPLIVNFWVYDYNLSFPPPRVYTLWVEIDVVIIPFDTKIYETRISIQNNETTNIDQDQFPLNWGALSILPITPFSILLFSILVTDIMVGTIVSIRRKLVAKNC